MTRHMDALHQLFDLSGRVALVSGGSRGLGLQIAEALGEFGATVVLAARKPAELEEAVAHLSAHGIAASSVVADLRGPEGSHAVAEQVMAAHGQIDVLVNNAGAAWGSPAEDHTHEAWRRVMDINLDGLFFLTQAVAKASMLPRGRGRIVNVASVAGLKGNQHGTGTAAYSASKGAVIALTRELAGEWGKRGITVNALAPGWFPSRMTKGTLDAHGDALAAQTPLGKLGGPHDLKGAALLFASDAGGHITGQVLAIDGGAVAV